jgi:hypothetical protein
LTETLTAGAWRVIAAMALPGSTVAPCATITWVEDVFTVSPSLSVPEQLVMPSLIVGSGVHCARAGAATTVPIAMALVKSAKEHRRNRTER